jgi:DNA-binding beta-propeller fold protein YncE
VAERWRGWRGALLILALVVPPGSGIAQTPSPPLVLEAKFPLGDVKGRIDHLAVDLKRQRLFVAELGNGSLGIVDLAAGKVLRTMTGFSEPQGVGYEPASDTLYVASAGDGSVRLFGGDDLAPIGRLDLGDDADNIRIDSAQHRVLVGYGKGALAVIDPVSHGKTGEFRLKGHPEGFQIDDSGSRAFVNVPDAREIEVVDLSGGTASRALSTEGNRANFPMALDPDAHRVLVVFRSPPTLIALSTQDGKIVAKLETCGDADDVFVDAKRHRVYVSCGEGAVDVLEPREVGYARLAKVPTVSGARTSLFVPEVDRLFVAARANLREPAAILVFRPTP